MKTAAHLRLHDGRYLLKAFDEDGCYQIDDTLNNIEDVISYVDVIYEHTPTEELELDVEDYEQDYIDYLRYS